MHRKSGANARLRGGRCGRPPGSATHATVGLRRSDQVGSWECREGSDRPSHRAGEHPRTAMACCLAAGSRAAVSRQFSGSSGTSSSALEVRHREILGPRLATICRTGKAFLQKTLAATSRRSRQAAAGEEAS